MANRSESYEVILRARDELSRVLKSIGPETLKSARQAERGLSGVGDALRRGTRLARDFGRGFGSVLRRIGGGIRRFLTPGIGQIALLVASFAGLGKIVGDASRFSQAMAEVSTIVDTTVVSLDDLEQGALRTARALGLNELDQAKALYQAISAGVDAGADSLVFLEQASKLAVAGVSNTAATVDVLTNILNAYGKEVQDVTRVSDILFTTVRLGKTTIDELASGLSVATPLAAQLGVSIEEVGAAVATITAGGGGTTAEAATQIAAVLRALLTNFEKIKEAVELAGGEFDIASIRAEGLAATLEKIRTATGGSEDQIIKLVTRAEALNAVLNLSGPNLQRFLANIGAVQDSAGSTGEALDKQLANPAKRLQVVLNSLRLTLQEDLGRAIISAANRAIEFAGGADRIIANFRVAGQVVAEFVGSGVEGFGRLIAKLNEFVDSAGGIERVSQIAVAGARVVAQAIQTGLLGAIETIQNLVRVLAGLPSAINAVIRDIPGLSLFGPETQEQIRKEKEQVLAEFRSVKAQVEQFGDVPVGQEPTKLRTLRAELVRLREEYAALTIALRTAPEDPAQVLSDFNLTRASSIADEAGEALAQSVAEFQAILKGGGPAVDTDALETFGARLAAPVMAAFFSTVKERFREIGPQLAEEFDVTPRDTGAPFALSAQEADAFRAFTREALEFEKALARTAQDRIRIAEEEADIRADAIRQRGIELNLTEEQIQALLGLSSQLEQANIAQALDFESFAGEVERFRSELKLTIDEQKEAIDRWAESERERLELLRIEGQLTDDQIAKLDALIDRLAAQRKEQAESSAESNRFANAQVAISKAIGTNTEDALVDLVTLTKDAKEAFSDLAQSILSDIARIAIRQAITGPLFGLPGFGLAKGGVVPGGLSNVRQLATGGVAEGGVHELMSIGRSAAARFGVGFKAAQRGDVFRSPHLAVIGEGKRDEAVVPLEGNRAIPVEMRGGGGGGNTFYTTNNYIDAIDTKSFDDRIRGSGETISQLNRADIANNDKTRAMVKRAAQGTG